MAAAVRTYIRAVIFDRFLDRTLLVFVSRASGPTVAVTAAVLYAGGGLALPLALSWRVMFLVEANVVFTVVAAVMCLVWFVVRAEAIFRRSLVEWTTDLRHLDSAKFEWLVGEVYRREGWAVNETGSVMHPTGTSTLS